MVLQSIWFVLIAVLYIGFFLLEGFDFGVGILLPFLSRDKDPEKVDLKRRVMINTIGPHWDANEVWLITAGGATFAAFPNWYATLFSGFYLALFLLLLTLIGRGVAFEFRSKEKNPRWRSLWDVLLFIGSLVPPLLLGVTFANLLRGVPIDAEMNYIGGFFNLLNPFALVAGVTSVLLCTLYGALFLTLKTTGKLVDKARDMARSLWLIGIIVLLLLLVVTYLLTDVYSHRGFLSVVFPLLALAAILGSGYYMRKKRDGWAFILTAATIALVLVSFFVFMYPRVMVSNPNPENSLTIENASSTQYTLNIMTIVAVIFLPIVLAYQAWSYWVFRKRIQSKPQELHY
jgi:cytochrome d ubiquinol oxidase subunit II